MICSPSELDTDGAILRRQDATFKRDYVTVHELRDAESVLGQLGRWFDDYNRQAPHWALGMRPPAE